MKLSKIISALAVITYTSSSVYADINQTKTSTAPIVGSSIVSVVATEIFATGYRASKLLKSNVYNEIGEKIGYIDDFIIGGNNNISFAVISVGGFLSIGSKHIAIPAILFNTNEKNQLVIKDAKKEDIEKLPAFNYSN